MELVPNVSNPLQWWDSDQELSTVHYDPQQQLVDFAILSIKKELSQSLSLDNHFASQDKDYVNHSQEVLNQTLF